MVYMARHLPQQDPERTGVDQQVGARQAGEQPHAADQEAPYLVTWRRLAVIAMRRPSGMSRLPPPPANTRRVCRRIYAAQRTGRACRSHRSQWRGRSGGARRGRAPVHDAGGGLW